MRPLSEYGMFTAITELFQGARNLRKVADKLQVGFMRRLDVCISCR
jgi:hypothetical protein